MARTAEDLANGIENAKRLIVEWSLKKKDAEHNIAFWEDQLEEMLRELTALAQRTPHPSHEEKKDG